MSFEGSISQFFQEVLGANLKNSRWSWGAVDPVFNRVFLRVWEDQIQSGGDGKKVLVYWKHPIHKSAGGPERCQHLQAIRHGAQGFGVVCRASDPDTTEVRRIAEFQEDPLLLLGPLTEDDMGIYSNIVGEISLGELTRAQTAYSTLGEDLRAILSKKAADATSKQTLVDARIGQGAFRSAVLQLWDHRCSVTGSTTMDVIRASHIKPWRDSTDEERLDPMNGLALVASLDALFDAGLISFEDSGRMLVASELPQREREILGVVGRSLAKKPSTETAAYLQHHRDRVFRK